MVQRLIIGFIAFCLTSSIAMAADPVLKQKPADTELKGLVVDKTVTPPGRRFYREFARLWWESEKELPGNLIVRELPSALRGSQISILFNRKVLFAAALSPARSNIEQTAQSAVRFVDEKLKMLRLSRLLTNNPDLAADDF